MIGNGLPVQIELSPGQMNDESMAELLLNDLPAGADVIADKGSRLRNPDNRAANHTLVLIELWLADAPEAEVRALLAPLAGNAEHQLVIDECWRERGNERRYTVPAKIKRKLCQLAVAYTIILDSQARAARPQVGCILQQARVDAETILRQRGWTDERIVAWFKTLAERQRKRKKAAAFRMPKVDKVLAVVNRRAPAVTLKAKSAGQKNPQINSAVVHKSPPSVHRCRRRTGTPTRANGGVALAMSFFARPSRDEGGRGRDRIVHGRLAA